MASTHLVIIHKVTLHNAEGFLWYIHREPQSTVVLVGVPSERPSGRFALYPYNAVLIFVCSLKEQYWVKQVEIVLCFMLLDCSIRMNILKQEIGVYVAQLYQRREVGLPMYRVFDNIFNIAVVALPRIDH